MSEVTFANDVTVKLVDSMASDEAVVQAAQVSAYGERDIQELIEKYEAGNLNVERFITALMKGRHGSPFEHTAFKFFVEAPIFVVREWQRHRMSSFNEMSGRYTKLMPKFYIPTEDRPVVNVGTSMKPKFDHNVYANHKAREVIAVNSRQAWNDYNGLLGRDVAPEVARMVLPLNIYTQFYWTVNARSLMNFISLRVQSENSTFPSYPQLEIQMGAEKIEEQFKLIMPSTHRAFVLGGRVAP